MEYEERNKKMRKLLLESKDEKKTLKEMSLLAYCCFTYHPNVYGYVISIKKINPQEEGYFFVLYNKRPYVKVLFVSEYVYSDFEKAKEETEYYLRNFALFASLKRLRLSLYPPFEKEEEERRKEILKEQEKTSFPPL